MTSSADDPAFHSFAQLAKAFCAWCEGDSLGLRREAIAAQWLARLYGAAIDLPKASPDSFEDWPDIQPHALEKATQNLACFNGWYYREIFDPDPANTDAPVMGDIGDDLLDTYQDVRRGLSLWDQGQHTQALCFWELWFRKHWGRHAAGAIFAFHCLRLEKRLD